jgi:very-short-patch-repair endonuclease
MNKNVEIVKKLISDNKSFSFILKTQKYKNIYDEIMSYTNHLNIKFIERIYWYINQLTDYPICILPDCNCKSTKFLKLETGYKKYCSAKCAARSDECKQKHIETNRKKYGVDNVAQNKNIKNKMQQTILERYGVTNIGAFKPNREKIKNTNIERYGTANGHKKDDSLEIGNNISITRCTNFYNKIINTNDEVKPLFSIDDYINSEKYADFKWHCNKCGNDFIGKIKHGKHIARCLNCYPYSESKPEQDILDYINSITSNLQIFQHNRSLLKPLEVDIYIPEKKLAIEFDGIYWHCDDILQNKNYHLNKTELCEKQGIQLIHIFENEWIYKQDIVKSRLKNLLGIYDKTIYARKCEIKEVNSKISKAFQEENHIQGSVNAKVSIGLYFEN